MGGGGGGGGVYEGVGGCCMGEWVCYGLTD